ncbi:glycosyltransferase family 2 protein [Dysgonomonas sp. ZJ279]|uniref:glycosyltransferase family 2 protein n=1 Tax=Dysgonomonas sp. ZJ279 TaxID=2709796 RepID=UPI0013EE2337|nr:glycosyltransferase family A protein [Dysgonomonas sp. ZJ279]
MFSIIIPLYNKENYIKKTISSVLGQTFTDYEVVIVDDGSTDNSLSVLSNFQDDRIKVYSKENGGVSSARNFGIEKAQGKYIAFLDADDYWEEDYLQSVYNTILKFPNCQIFATAQTVLSNDGQTVNKCNNRDEDYFMINDYCSSASAFQTSGICAFKTSLVEVGGFRDGVKRGEDIDCWLRLACNNKIAYCNVPKVVYNLETENGANLSFSSIKESFPYTEWYDYSYENKAALMKYTTSMLLMLSLKAYKSGERDEALTCLRNIKGNDMFLKRLIIYFRVLLMKKNRCI